MRIREPVNAWSHLIGLLFAAVGTVALLRMANERSQVVAFGIYGGTLILLYSASALYHSLWLSDRGLRRLRTLDHIAIYFLIAGTYTPLSLIILDGPIGWGLLTAVWAIAALGIPFKILFLEAPIWLSTGTYLGMGYLSLVALVPLAKVVPPAGVAWLVAGGIAYTVGAIIFARQRPNPLPGVFGHHEIWHILVLVGSACHFAFILFHVAHA